jgi:hypothetical protein
MILRNGLFCEMKNKDLWPFRRWKNLYEIMWKLSSILREIMSPLAGKNGDSWRVYSPPFRRSGQPRWRRVWMRDRFFGITALRPACTLPVTRPSRPCEVCWQINNPVSPLHLKPAAPRTGETPVSRQTAETVTRPARSSCPGVAPRSQIHPTKTE